MNLAYIFAELSRRPARALMAALSLALGVALFVSLQAYADGYRQAARAPLAEVGADLAAQRQGAVPEKFEGLVFPHSVAPIHRDEIDRIRGLPGVRAVAEVMFFWSFEPGGFVAGLGLDPADTFGPGRLQASLTAGRFFEPQERGVALADSTYAQQSGLALGNVAMLGGQPFTIRGMSGSHPFMRRKVRTPFTAFTSPETISHQR